MNLSLFDPLPPAEPRFSAPRGGEDTRNASFRETMGDDKLPARRRAVLNAIRVLQPVSDREVSVYLRVPVNCVTGRRNELLADKRIERAGTVYDTDTRRNVATWRVAEETQR